MLRQKKSLRLLRKRKLHVGRLTNVFKLAETMAELELWGRRVDNCWRQQMMVALKYVTLVSYGVVRT